VRKSELKTKPMDINQIVRAVVKFTEHEARHHRTMVRLQLDPQLPKVEADSIMIEQVICNLVRNAVEAMAEANSPRREITIRTHLFGNDAIEIEIGDTGPGVDEAVIDQVFDQFFTTKPEGVGMGLSISRSIIESHGGQVRAESGGTGATFRFTLPTSEGQTTKHERADSLHS
jgi:signal transduction histidine kinase